MSDNLEINIEEIIQEIRKEIQEKGYQETDLNFSDIPIPEHRPPQLASAFQGSTQSELKNVLDYLNANYEHDIMLPVQFSNPIAAVGKKLVRKLVRFLFYPVLARQNMVNSSVVNALNILSAAAERQNESEQKIAALQEKVQALEEELRQFKAAEAENRKRGTII